MKFNYIFSVGESVIDTNTGEVLTISKRIGSGDTPAYKVIENGFLYNESALISADSHSKEEKEEEKQSEEKNIKEKREELYNFLCNVDTKNKEISKFARNLNLLALKDKITPAYGREKELEEIQELLERRTKPNVILTGKAGCGKTAIIEELARTFVNIALESDTTTPIIYDLSLNSLIGGAKYRGDFEERIKDMLETITYNSNIILFIDEIHMMNDLGRDANNSITFGQILKPMLARGEIRVIGATTTEEYNNSIAKDKALKRRFSTIEVNEITGESKKECAEKILTEYSNYFKIKTNNIIVDNILNIISTTMNQTVFPDNFINIIDETFARAKFKKKEEITNTEINETLTRHTGMLII